MSNNTSIADKIKQKIDDLGLTSQVESAVTTVREKASTLAAERGDQVEALLDKASSAIGERTDGRYAPQVEKVRETVSTTITRLAQSKPQAD